MSKPHVSTPPIKRAAFWLTGVVVPGVDGDALAEGVEAVLADLTCDAVLIADVPPADLDALRGRTSLGNWFEAGQTFFVEEDDPDALGTLAVAGALVPGSTLLIDRDPVRTLDALRRGIDVSIFVSADRLYRDLWLWGLTPHPSPHR